MGDGCHPINLSSIGEQNNKLFRNTIERLNGNSPGEQALKASLAAEADRYKLWAVNMGLFVSGHGSLDYRVKEAENIRNMLETLLNTLKDSLNEVIEYHTASDEPDPNAADDEESVDESSDDGWAAGADEEIESALELLLESVKDPIDRLYRLALFIRNPTSRFSSSKMRRHQQVDEDTGINFLTATENFDLDHVRSIFSQYRRLKERVENPHVCDGKFEAETEQPAPPPGDRNSKSSEEPLLIRRLALANYRRRQQFSYWRKHRQKLSPHTSNVTEDWQGPDPKPSFILPKQISDLEGMNLQPQPLSTSKPASSPVSVTTATLLKPPQHSHINDHLSIVSVSQYAPSDYKPGNETLNFPPAPKHSKHEKFFECPYCYTLCDRALLHDTAWRAHLLHDLQPYVCTYESCKNPDQMYDRREDWLQHESMMHRRVYCCPEHSNETFYSLEDFKHHIRIQHQRYDNDMTILMIHSSESTLTVPDRACPICEQSIEIMEDLQKHIALHLERFALFSLPRDVDDDITARDGESHQANQNLEGSRDEDFSSSMSFSSQVSIEEVEPELVTNIVSDETLQSLEDKVEPDQSVINITAKLEALSSLLGPGRQGIPDTSHLLSGISDRIDNNRNFEKEIDKLLLIHDIEAEKSRTARKIKSDQPKLKSEEDFKEAHVESHQNIKQRFALSEIKQRNEAIKQEEQEELNGWTRRFYNPTVELLSTRRSELSALKKELVDISQNAATGAKKLLNPEGIKLEDSVTLLLMAHGLLETALRRVEDLKEEGMKKFKDLTLNDLLRGQHTESWIMAEEWFKDKDVNFLRSSVEKRLKIQKDFHKVVKNIVALGMNDEIGAFDDFECSIIEVMAELNGYSLDDSRSIRYLFDEVAYSLEILKVLAKSFWVLVDIRIQLDHELANHEMEYELATASWEFHYAIVPTEEDYIKKEQQEIRKTEEIQEKYRSRHALIEEAWNSERMKLSSRLEELVQLFQDNLNRMQKLGVL